MTSQTGHDTPNLGQACEHYSVMIIPRWPQPPGKVYREHALGAIGIAVSGATILRSHLFKKFFFADLNFES
jgi:hypothetical protein